jgi:signal transduction histidine kinase
MELWIVITKLILLLYIVGRYVLAEMTDIPWVVFGILLYFSLNLALYIVKQQTAKKVISLLSIAFIILFHAQVNPLFILLLPVSTVELASSYISKSWQLFLLALVPMLFIPPDLLSLYGLMAALTFVIFTMTQLYTTRLHKLEHVLTTTRRDMQKLSRSLNENQEYMQQSEYTIKLEERNRVSQAIHDQIGHTMTGALIQMEASKRLMTANQEQAAQLLQNAIQISKEGIESIRLTLKNLKPPVEQLGINRLKLFIDEFSANHEVRTSLVYKGDLEIITPIQWKIIQENTTEALTNAMKYAEPRNISISIHVLNTFVRVEVKDDGKGAPKIKKGLGIVGMEERTAAVHGTVIVDGTNGFSVTTLIPIR